MAKTEQVKQLQNNRKKDGLCIVCAKPRDGKSTFRCEQCMQRNRKSKNSFVVSELLRITSIPNRVSCGGGYRIVKAGSQQY
jgi:recombinational DNA repair protein RecR